MSTAHDFTRIGRGLVGCLAVLALLGAATAAPGPAGQEEELDLSTTMGRGRACTQWFYAQEFDRIEALGVTDAMQQALVPVGGFEGSWEALNTQLGAETQVVEETESEQEGHDIYLRTAKFENFAGDVDVQWVFDDEGAIAGFTVRPKQ